MKEKKSLLRNDGFQTLLSSLACILGGLIVGYIALLIIEPKGAFEAIVAVMKSFLRYPGKLKMKYFADNDFASLSGEKLADALKEQIRKKDGSLVGNMKSEGTTPRQLTDLIGSLCDLTSGSGDRGTPVVLIQGYFTNFATE